MFETVEYNEPPSDDMRLFLTDWYDWATGEADEDNEHGFLRSCGLRGNLFSWCGTKHNFDSLLTELTDLLGGEGFHFVKDRNQLISESELDISYRNDKRLAWVKSTLGR